MVAKYIRNLIKNTNTMQYHSSSSDNDDTDTGLSEADAEDSSSDESQATSEKTDQLRKSKKADKLGTKPKNVGSAAVVDVMAKILAKKGDNQKSVILSKGSTDKEIQAKQKKEKKGDEADHDGADDDDDDVDWEKLIEHRKQKRLWEEMGRLKPTVFDREKEKALQRIATRGVVQLFNAVKKQQKLVDDKMQDVGGSVRKRDNVMQTMTKGKFLDVLKGTSVSNMTNEPITKKIKTEPYIKEEKIDPSWSILRDDFMMGAKMKDWDKASDDSDGNSNHRRKDDSDSDT